MLPTNPGLHLAVHPYKPRLTWTKGSDAHSRIGRHINVVEFLRDGVPKCMGATLNGGLSDIADVSWRSVCNGNRVVDTTYNIALRDSCHNQFG